MNELTVKQWENLVYMAVDDDVTLEIINLFNTTFAFDVDTISDVLYSCPGQRITTSLAAHAFRVDAIDDSVIEASGPRVNTFDAQMW